MHELTPDNTLEYLRDRGWIGAGPARIESLGGGVSNQVLGVVTETTAFVLKQSRPQLRTRDAWYSDLDRIYREQEVMEALAPLLPAVVPQVLFVDRDNYTYAMSHAPGGAVPWKGDLLSGKLDPSMAERAGRVLGVMHEGSAQRAHRFDAFRDHTVYVQLRVEPFYRRIQERRPEVASQVGNIIEGMLTIKQALCHGDYTPKNMLVHDHGFTLVDYETAHFGDPTMDLGLFLTHLTLKAARRPGHRHAFVDLMRRFWQAYRNEVRFRPADELEARGAAHLGVCLLARIDGTSPVEYLAEESRREAVRRLARTILHAPLGRWDDVWQHAERDFAMLENDT
jgi:5-methylthioribose kinase